MSRLQGKGKNKFLLFRDAAYDYIKVNGPATTSELMARLSPVSVTTRTPSKLNGRKNMPRNINIAAQMMVRDNRFLSRDVVEQGKIRKSTRKEWYIHEN